MFPTFTERRDPSSSSSQLEKQDSAESSVFNERMVEDALRALIESIRHRSGILSMWGPNNKAPSSSPALVSVFALIQNSLVTGATFSIWDCEHIGHEE